MVTKKVRKWHKLDNMGKFYSLLAGRRVQNVFRYSASFVDNIDSKMLQRALDETIEIFSNFNVNLRKGLFWYYLEETNRKNKVSIENLPICFRIYNTSEDFLYRVSYFKKRINFEVSHIITDGRGSLDFFRCLISNYAKIKYSLLNIDMSNDSSYMEKSEDSFKKYYKKTKGSKEDKNKIYRYKAKKIRNKTRYMEAHIPVSKVLELAHIYDTTLTAFITAVYIYSFKDVMQESELNKYIKINIPVDLRGYYKSSSSKNFFGIMTVSYKFDSRNDTLENVVQSVKKQFKENLVPEKLSERVNKMIGLEKNIFCRAAPLFLKNLALYSAGKALDESSTSNISNIGKVTLDKEVAKFIKDINILTATASFQIVICSFKDDLSIGISSKYEYNEVLKNFCRFFTQNGIDMNINSSEVD